MKLSDIMRYSLRSQDGDGMVALNDELEHVQNVVDLARIRFSNKIYIEVDLFQDNSNIRIAPLALVTLVENIFKHGDLSDRYTPGQISLTQRDAETLKFRTWNKKRTIPEVSGTGIGLSNTTARLKELYGVAVDIRVLDGENDFAIEIVFPLLAPASTDSSQIC